MNMRRNFERVGRARLAKDGTWRVTCPQPQECEIIIRGADARAALAFDAPLADLGIEWQERCALLSMMSADRVATVEADAVIVHESAGGLYAALPLAQYDSRARRFWRRVFFLVRVPGGRSLLGVLAHASRKRS